MILDKEEFRSWLVAKEPDESVGTKAECPLERFIAETFDENWWVSQSSYGPFDGRSHRLLDVGLLGFPESVDTGDTGDGWERITAKDALTILDSLDVA